MIDKIKIYKKIDLDVEKFSNKFKYEYKRIPPEIDMSTGEILKDGYVVDRYIYKHCGLAIKYSNKTKKLSVEGRLPNISTIRNLVHTLDDFLLGQEKKVSSKIKEIEKDSNTLCENAYYDENDELVFSDQWEIYEQNDYVQEDLDSIIIKTNKKIYELTSVRLNIEEFDVSNIEVTFNIFDTKNVDKYIELFNLIFKDKKDKRYKNFVLENNKKLGSSFYVKSKTNYKNNTNNSYTMNFYNKLDQLEKLEKNPRNNSKVTYQDKKLAEDVLRLEVQLAYRELKKTSKVFKEFLNIDFCKNIIIDKYKYFISRNENLDFYCYKTAKEKIINTDLLDENNKKYLLRYIQQKYKSNKKFSPKTEQKFKKMLGELGIHYYFIPTKWKIDYMISPIKLLNDKIEYIKKIGKCKI